MKDVFEMTALGLMTYFWAWRSLKKNETFSCKKKKLQMRSRNILTA